MDSLTQIVLGAAVGEAVLGKKVGNKAMLYGAIAGTIPDLDTFVGKFFDTITEIEIHRGFSHSIVFAILFAPVFGWLISKIESNETSAIFDGKGGCFLESGRDTASIIEVDMFTNSKPSTKLTESTKDNLSKKLDFEKERLSKWL